MKTKITPADKLAAFRKLRNMFDDMQPPTYGERLANFHIAAKNLPIKDPQKLNWIPISTAQWPQIVGTISRPSFEPGAVNYVRIDRARVTFSVRFVDRNNDCRTIIVKAFSKRHAKKLARRAAPVRQWLMITHHR